MPSSLLAVSPSQAVGARLSVPVVNQNNVENPELTRPRSASLRSTASTTLWTEDKKCIICPLKDAVRQLASPQSASVPVEQPNGISSNESTNPTNAPLYKSYAQRWLVLATVCLLALSNATQWIAFAPLHEAANTFYCHPREKSDRNETIAAGGGSDCDVETWSSQIFQIVGVLTGLFGMFITDRYGIRIATYFGATLNLLGAIIRVVSSLPLLHRSNRLPTLYFGQTVAAMSQPFFLCLSPKVAEYWFEEDQRALANSLSFIANPFGVLVGSIVPVIFVSSNPSAGEERGNVLDTQILYLNISLFGLASLVMLLCLFVRRSRPPTPPSASSQCEHKPGFSDGLGILLRSPVFYIQMLTFGMAFALQWSIFVTADKHLIGLGYNDSKVTGYLLSLSALSGTLASVFAGWLVDRTKKFNEFIKVSYVGIAFSAIALDVLLHFHHKSDWDTALLVLLFALLGFFTIPVFPISLELGVESTFPVAEATSSGILIIAGQLQLFLLTFAMQSLESVDWIYGEEHNYKLSIDFWASCAVFAIAFSCIFLWPRYYRLEYEQNAVFLNLLPPRFDEIGNGNIGAREYQRKRGSKH